MESLNSHITNLNRMLKSIKSEVMVDFVYSDYTRIMIVTKNITMTLNIKTIKKYIKKHIKLIQKRLKFLDFLNPSHT